MPGKQLVVGVEMLWRVGSLVFGAGVFVATMTYSLQAIQAHLVRVESHLSSIDSTLTSPTIAKAILIEERRSLAADSALGERVRALEAGARHHNWKVRLPEP